MAFVSAPPALRSSASRRSTCDARRNVGGARRTAPRMEVTVKSEVLPKSKVALDITVGPDECSKAWQKALRELSKNIKVDGFRKGKVPKAVLEGQYGPALRSSALELVVEDGIQKAMGQTGMRSIGQASFEDGDRDVPALMQAYSPQGELSFRVTIDVWPEPTFNAPYTGLAVTADDVPVGDDVVDAALEEMRNKEAFSVLAPADAVADYGRLCVVDMKGYYENEDGTRGDELPALADGENIEVELREGKFFAGFVEGLIGAKAGEEREVHLTFPEHNPRVELAGRKAFFDVKVNAIKDKVMPELDDAFAQRVSEADNIDSLREVVRGRLRAEGEAAREKNVAKALEDALAEIVEVELPETLVENQLKRNFATMMSGFSNSGMTPEQVKAMITKDNFDLYRERGLPKAERALRVNFAVSQIAKECELTVPIEDINAQIDLTRSEMRGQEFDEDEVRDQIESQLERELVINKLKETAQITFVIPAEESTPVNASVGAGGAVAEPVTVDSQPVVAET